jgi:molybdenum cofactor synthesis domain-containing protein
MTNPIFASAQAVSTDSSSQNVVESAAALIVGSELLSGKIRDENLHELSVTLRAMGIHLRRVIICPDDINTIAEDLVALLAGHDVVFTSGGLGPTHDDVTVAGVCKALGIGAERSSEMVQIIEKIYGASTTDNHRLMAHIPRGAQLIDTGGWPLIVAGRIWLLPGVPELFKSKLAAVRRELRGPGPIHSRTVKVSVEEAFIKDSLDLIVKTHPAVEIGSYPKWFDPTYKTLITLDGRAEHLVSLAHEQLRLAMAAYLVGE